MNRVQLVSAVSLVYDASIGLALVAARPLLASLFRVPLPQPPIFADLDAVFLIAIAVGYVIPLRDPVRGRGYLWTMGPLLKGMGAVAFVLDYILRGSPASFLLFAASDGTMAMATGWALLTSPAAGAVEGRAGFSA